VTPVLSVSLLAGALASDNRSSLRLMVSQPMCAGLLVGLVLGNPGDGFLAGAILQMLFLGMIPVRGIAAPDLALGGVTASALYVLVPRSMGAARDGKGLVLLLSLVAALIAAAAGRALYRLWYARSYALTERARRFVEAGRAPLASALHFSTVGVHFAAGFAVAAAAVIAGAAVIGAIAAAASGPWCEPLGSLPMLLPFIGAGTLLMLNLTRVRLFLFLAGFCMVFLIAFFRG
jgi:mannose/fructose/N-acetylgalactosamine-specific phosphotransferase system component IIC